MPKAAASSGDCELERPPDRPPGGRSIAFLLWRRLPHREVPSAAVYPWYLLWVLPWAALHEERRWLLLAALMPLAYLPALFGVPLWPWVYLSIWAPFALFSSMGKRWSPS